MVVELIHDPQDLYQRLLALRREGKSIGVVPTMGALHAGHLSLVTEAQKRCQAVVATIFVNPTQFGPNEDFGRYPRTLDQDRVMLQQAGCDFLFVPSTESMYPKGFSTFIEPPLVAQRWDGEKRPGHFRGVATIVLKLLHMVPATQAFFGQKDYQQWQVIRSMVRDLNLPIEIVGCPIIRDPDGLAMSSRNRYLSSEERTKALGLSRAIEKARSLLAHGDFRVANLQAAMEQELLSSGIDSIDYAVIVDTETLEPIVEVQSQGVALLAAKVGATRLIDNGILIR